jgi:hypothetical protein
VGNKTKRSNIVIDYTDFPNLQQDGKTAAQPINVWERKARQQNERQQQPKKDERRQQPINKDTVQQDDLTVGTIGTWALTTTSNSYAELEKKLDAAMSRLDKHEEIMQAHKNKLK